MKKSVLYFLVAFPAAFNAGCSSDRAVPEPAEPREPLSVVFGTPDYVRFAYGETKSLEAVVGGGSEIDVSAPNGWTADYNAGRVTITAPSGSEECEPSGKVTLSVADGYGNSRRAWQYVRLESDLVSVRFLDSGPVLFRPGTTQNLSLETQGVQRAEVVCPEGWTAVYEPGLVAVTAPSSLSDADIEGTLGITVYSAGDTESASAGITVKLDVEPADLSAVQTANCYMVSQAGYYSFDATVMGNGVGTVNGVSILPGGAADASLSPASARLLWQDTPGLVRRVGLTDGRIEVQINGLYGNAVVAACDAGGKILWSWHLWCTPQPAEQLYPENAAGRRYTLLDRNLGASAAVPGDYGNIGLLYQWGRKDPFVSAASSVLQGWESEPFQPGASREVYDIEGGPVAFSARETSDEMGTGANAVANPMEFYYSASSGVNWYRSEAANYLWGNPDGYRNPGGGVPTGVKSLYDPCPPGYRVPPADTWYSDATFGNDEEVFLWDETNGGRMLSYEGVTIYYPASGYRSYSNNGEWGRGRLWHVGFYGDYWTNSPSVCVDYDTKQPYYTNSYMMRITKSYCVPSMSEGYRAEGIAVRCMKDE